MNKFQRAGFADGFNEVLEKQAVNWAKPLELGADALRWVGRRLGGKTLSGEERLAVNNLPGKYIDPGFIGPLPIESQALVDKALAAKQLRRGAMGTGGLAGLFGLGQLTGGEQPQQNIFTGLTDNTSGAPEMQNIDWSQYLPWILGGGAGLLGLYSLMR